MASISYASNNYSIRAQRMLDNSSKALAKTFERLSSGQRINTAGDDPAGLALADTLKAQSQIASVAIRNANDGISITSLADSALGEIGNILSRMSELATQSANGVYSNTQRSAMASEFLSLGSEIERIATTTTFNNISLLSNSSNITLQVGFNAGANSQITLQGVSGTLQALSLASTGSSAMSYSIMYVLSGSVTDSQSAAQNALNAVNSAITSLGTIRGLIGAAENRLSFAISNLSAARENFLAAEGRIRDADVAQDAADMVRLQVLQQAGTAVLAQANQQPSQALALLQ